MIRIRSFFAKLLYKSFFKDAPDIRPYSPVLFLYPVSGRMPDFDLPDIQPDTGY
jgi:hypothetical protein